MIRFVDEVRKIFSKGSELIFNSAMQVATNETSNGISVKHGNESKSRTKPKGLGSTNFVMPAIVLRRF